MSHVWFRVTVPVYAPPCRVQVVTPDRLSFRLVESVELLVPFLATRVYPVEVDDGQLLFPLANFARFQPRNSAAVMAVPFGSATSQLVPVAAAHFRGHRSPA
ncbi:MAG: hypothetical protein U0871_17815 [Gemmataceae bacterium]